MIFQDLTSWVQGKQEVELVDMVLRIRQKLQKSNEDDVPIGDSVQDMLRERINDITRTLPDDLKTILNQNSWHYSKNLLLSLLLYNCNLNLEQRMGYTWTKGIV